MNSQEQAITALLDSLLFRMDEKTEMVLKCLDMLTEEELWNRPNKASNSMGNLLLHLCGNITQYIISALGQKEDIRKRDLEFSVQGGITKSELTEKLLAVLEEAKRVMKSLDTEQWLSEYSVQGFSLTGIGIAVHAVEHYAYHTGQIAFWTKQIKARDLGFYAGTDLNAKNES